MGSVRWMAYELLAPQESGPQKTVDATFENTITETKPAVPSMETDVWAFGMVVYVGSERDHLSDSYLFDVLGAARQRVSIRSPFTCPNSLRHRNGKSTKSSL